MIYPVFYIWIHPFLVADQILTIYLHQQQLQFNDLNVFYKYDAIHNWLFILNRKLFSWYSSFRYLTGTCRCGVDDTNIKEFKSGDGLWCCKSTKDACTVEESDSDGDAKIVHCQGNAIPLTQQCTDDHNTTTNKCNFYPGDEDRNFYATRSFLDLCQDNR